MVIKLRSTKINNSAAFPGKVSQHEFFDVPQFKLNGTWTQITAMGGWTQGTYGGLDTSYFNSGNNWRFDIWDTRYQ